MPVKDKVLFNAWIDPKVAGKLRAAAKHQGKTYSVWLEETVMMRVKHIEAADGKRFRSVSPRVMRRKEKAA